MLDKDKSIEVFNKIINYQTKRALDQMGLSITNKHVLYGLSFDFDNSIESCIPVMDGMDAYGVIADAIVKTSCSKDWNYLALYTEGWASPYDPDEQDNDIPPSQHPLKKRVQIVCIITKADPKHIESVMLIEGNSQLEYTSGGKGQLAKSLLSIYLNKKNENTNTKQFYI